MWDFYFHTDCNECGQTSRSAVGPEIQTNRNSRASAWNYRHLVVGVPFSRHVVLLEIHIFMITLCVNVLLCLAASTCCYMKIYFTLRYRQTRVSQRSRPGRMNNSTTAHLAAYNKTVSNSLWIYFTLIASYLPFAIVQIVRTAYGDSPLIVIAEASTTSLVYLNSSLNPVIYFWRIREVRQAVKTTLRRFFSFCF